MTTLILSVFFSISASAYDVEVDGIYYLTPKKNVAIVTYGDKEYSGDITIPSSIKVNDLEYTVKEIKENTFRGCRSLTSVTIPNSVTSIAEETFYNCSGLTSVTIPNSVTSIGELAFWSCSSLTSVSIPNSVASIGSYAFYDCSGLTSVTIPNSLTIIEHNVFYDCSGLTSITIPNSVTSIGGFAFRGCSGLTSITIPNSVTNIENTVFAYCSSLTSITIPNSVTSIGSDAFYGCSGLTSITIPNSVTSIGGSAFAKCGNLENLYCYAEKIPYLGYYIFKDSYIEYATLHVPSSALSYYQTTEPWNGFGTIKAIEGTEGIESVEARGIAIQSAGGFITISGLDNNEKVSFYGIDGKALGTATAINGTTSFAAQSGSVVVAKIGKESIKIAVK